MSNSVMENGATYEEMRSIAERIRELGIEPSVLTRLYSDHLARQGFDPRKLRVSDPGAAYNYRGLYYPETTETGAPMPQERMDEGLAALNLGPLVSAVRNGERFTPGDTLLALRPGESINDRVDTVLHEARHRGDSARGNWVPGMQQGSGAEEAVVRYLDVMYGSEQSKRASGQWLLQKGYDPLQPPPQVAPYLAETLQATGRFAKSNPLDRAVGTPAMVEMLARNPNSGYQGEAPSAPYRPSLDAGEPKYAMVQPTTRQVPAPTRETVQQFLDSVRPQAPDRSQSTLRPGLSSLPVEARIEETPFRPGGVLAATSSGPAMSPVPPGEVKKPPDYNGMIGLEDVLKMSAGNRQTAAPGTFALPPDQAKAAYPRPTPIEIIRQREERGPMPPSKWALDFFGPGPNLWHEMGGRDMWDSNRDYLSGAHIREVIAPIMDRPPPPVGKPREPYTGTLMADILGRVGEVLATGDTPWGNRGAYKQAGVDVLDRFGTALGKLGGDNNYGSDQNSAPSGAAPGNQGRQAPKEYGTTYAPKPSMYPPAAPTPQPVAAPTAASVAPRAESPEPSPYTNPLDAPVLHVETKGGSYPVYQKDSAPAQSFRSAYAEAKGAGAKDFTWESRSYNTK